MNFMPIRSSHVSVNFSYIRQNEKVNWWSTNENNNEHSSIYENVKSWNLERWNIESRSIGNESVLRPSPMQEVSWFGRQSGDQVIEQREEKGWQVSTGSISRGKDKFLIGPRYTDDSLLLDLITPRYGGLYKAPSTARILITFCLKPAKLFFRGRLCWLLEKNLRHLFALSSPFLSTISVFSPSFSFSLFSFFYRVVTNFY